MHLRPVWDVVICICLHVDSAAVKRGDRAARRQRERAMAVLLTGWGRQRHPQAPAAAAAAVTGASQCASAASKPSAQPAIPRPRCYKKISEGNKKTVVIESRTYISCLPAFKGRPACAAALRNADVQQPQQRCTGATTASAVVPQRCARNGKATTLLAAPRLSCGTGGAAQRAAAGSGCRMCPG